MSLHHRVHEVLVTLDRRRSRLRVDQLVDHRVDALIWAVDTNRVSIAVQHWVWSATQLPQNTALHLRTLVFARVHREVKK